MPTQTHLMKRFLKKILRLLFVPLVIFDYWRFTMQADSRFQLRIFDAYPQIKDKTVNTSFDRHYVYFTAWAARQVAKFQPKEHVDISSSLYFSGIVSAFVPVKFYDYRPAELSLSRLTSDHADLMNLPFPDNSILSLSSMHVVEHIGLGRYGDPLDAHGDQKAAQELSRVLAPGGQLLFVVPVGAKALIEWNAHRIYSYEAVLSLFPNLTLKEFTLIPERSGPPTEHARPESLHNERYACGCFVFEKS